MDINGQAVFDCHYSVSVTVISAHADVCFPILNKGIKLRHHYLIRDGVADTFSNKIIIRGFR